MSEEQQGIDSIEKALDHGQVFLAHNIASELILEYPNILRLSQLNVIALNRLGQPGKALEIILKIIKNGSRDGETMGLLGRTYKDLYKISGNSDYLSKAAEAYFTGYLYSHEYYPAINAASLFLMLGDKAKANQIAKEVIAQIGYSRDYWSTATLGEAYLILGNDKEAITHFKKAVEENPRQFGKFQSTYAQLSFLSEAVSVEGSIVNLFPKPKIAVFSGHMIDDPDRIEKRFPSEIEGQVKEELKKQVDNLDIDIGFTSLASGGDILFAEILKEKKAEIKAYMPFRMEDFLATSVSKAGMGWIKRFKNCYDCAPKYLTSEPYLETPDLFNHMGRVMIGECLLLSDQFDTVPSLVTILAPNQIRKSGGTNDLINLWPFKETHHNVDPYIFLEDKILATKKIEITKNQTKSDPRVKRKISNILFADIVGFSKLLEEDTPGIILSLLDRIKELIKPFIGEIEVINTWGDAVIICHPNIESTFQMASLIQGVFLEEEAKHLNLPEGLNIRIALHSGPAFFATDPLTGEPNVYGSSVNRTARMEPVTLPGAIYASDQFAASLKLESLDRFKYQHVGIIELPKGFGKQEVYQIIE